MSILIIIRNNKIITIKYIKNKKILISHRRDLEIRCSSLETYLIYKQICQQIHLYQLLMLFLKKIA